MKGVIFTEFFGMLEKMQSPSFVQELIDETDLPSKGVYTKVGTYPSCEIGALVTTLSEKTGLTIPQLLKAYGKHLFSRFVALYPHYFENTTNAFDFLHDVEEVIHKDVRKLYPDAQLPKFEIISHEPNRFHFIYISSNKFADLCEGLIYGCLEYFGEEAELSQTDLKPEAGARVEYILEKKAS